MDKITLLEKIKGLRKDADDTLIDYFIDDAIQAIKTYCNLTDLLDDMSNIVIKLTIYYIDTCDTPISLTSESFSGYSYSYLANSDAILPDSIKSNLYPYRKFVGVPIND